MKKAIVFLMFLILISVRTFADSSQSIGFNTTKSDPNLNFSDSTYLPNIKIKEIRQDPYPANPGDYVEIYIKTENYGTMVRNPRFEMQLNYPFSLDQSSYQNDPILSMDTGEKRTLLYKIKVDKGALPGVYEIAYKVYVDEKNFYPYFFNIKIDDVTSDFEVAIQEITDTGVSLGISNIGKNDVQSLVLKLNNQTDFDLLGYDAYIIGSLNKGDDTTVDIQVVPKENKANLVPKLNAQLDYTDALGYRRSVNKAILIKITPQIKLTFDNIYNKAYNIKTKASSSSENFYKISSILLLIALIFLFIRGRRSRKTK